MFSSVQENVSALLTVFESFLITAPATADYDPVRQSIVILMGNLARHLDPGNPKVKPIVAQLIAALSTPSQEVSVCECCLSAVPGSWVLYLDPGCCPWTLSAVPGPRVLSLDPEC